MDKKVFDDLSRQYTLLATMRGEFITFGRLKDLYKKDEDFGEI